MADGEQTIGEYKVVSVIASGNSTRILEVTDISGPGRYAMKVLTEDAFTNAGDRATLKHEAKVAKSLDHPSFVMFHGVTFTKETGFILMDYFRAPNLKSHISSDRHALIVRFRKLFESLTLGLAHMHEKGWVHRDVKPENILFNKASELRLIDFSLSTRVVSGLAALLGGKQKTVQGTLSYIAPETIRKKPATPATDIYSLGIVMYEVLTGRTPFKAPTPAELLKMHLSAKPVEPSEFNPNITPELDRFVLGLLAKKPDARPKNLNEVYSQLRSVKLFKEDPQELAQRTEKERQRQQEELDNLSVRLDSRTDHRRTEENPERKTMTPAAKKPAAQTTATSSPAASATPARPAGGAAAGRPQTTPGPQQNAPGLGPQFPQGPWPQGMPWPPQMMPYPQGQPFPQGYPPNMPPGTPYPGGPYPGAWPPGATPAAASPPTGLPTGGPGVPGQPVPGQPVPGQPVPGQPASGPPAPGQPAPGQPGAQQPSPGTAPPPAGKPPEKPAEKPAAAEEQQTWTDIDELDVI